MNEDFDGLEWLRDIRKQIAVECHYNTKVMGDYYRSLQPADEHRYLKEDDDMLTSISRITVQSD